MIAQRPVVLMTRPKAASRAFIADLKVGTQIRFDALCSPLIGIKPLEPPPDLGRYRGLIFTSANGVEAYRALGGTDQGMCFAVGEATACAARAAGLVARSAQGDAGALIALVTASQNPGPLLHLRGTHSRGDVAASLCAAGIETDEAVIYDQPLRPLSSGALAALVGPALVIAPLFSPRTARHFVHCHQGQGPLYLIAMSRRVADELADLPFNRMVVAAQPTGAAMKKAAWDTLDLVAALEAGKGAH